MARAVLASRRFQREYPQFLRKYPDTLESTFKNFLDFRQVARPDEPFNPKDSRIPGTKFGRCHLIFGRAILIYQLHGSEIRLIAIDDHKAIESGSNKMMRNYARSLTPEDYYQFDVNAPLPVKPDASINGVMIKMETEIESKTPELVNDPSAEKSANPLWDAKSVHYLRDRQMLYEPRPTTNKMIVLRLSKELIAPQGDVLVIDLLLQTIHHLTENELEAHFQPTVQQVTTLEQAVTSATQAPVAPAEPEIVAAQPDKLPLRPQKHRVSPQLGRLVLTMAHLQKTKRSRQLDSAIIKQHMPERDRKTLSVLMSNAQKEQIIKKNGIKTGKSVGRAYYYCLTPSGERVSETLGEWPFAVAGLRSAFPVAVKQ